MELSEIIKSFESSTKNPKRRYKEFCAHCWYVFDKKIKSTKSDKTIKERKDHKEDHRATISTTKGKRRHQIKH